MSIAFSQISPNDSVQDCDGTAITSCASKTSGSTNTRGSSEEEDLTMPITSGSPSLLASLPSFMSVFGNGTDVRRSMGGEVLAVSSNKPVNVAKRPSPCSHFSSPIIRRDSASTFESADSSPTTTISTLDSALTEPSPSSSPESPTAQLPLTSLKPLSTNLGFARSVMDSKDRPLNPFTTLPGHRADSPNKKMRNTKNLMVNTNASSRQGPPKLAISTTVPTGDGHPFSAPPTPSFIFPPKPPRRRPSNLGLTLSTVDSNIAAQPILEGLGHVPQTPFERQARPLHCTHLSANTPLFSPTMAPEGGMRLPPFGNSSIASRLGYSRAPLTASYPPQWENIDPSAITLQTLHHVREENDLDLPLSREVKSPAYPQGPVCIYEPFVYLYLEPTQTEASEFDVVMNVAREVKNPFVTAADPQPISRSAQVSVQASERGEHEFLAGRGSISESQTAIADKVFRATFEAQLPERTRDVHEPSTALGARPEYIHIPWDHNTNVVDDLLQLCELIDDRVRQQKRVLIHCQCGVSRSASLVVAYGLYKNPQLTVQDAYNIVKGHSRWIGPNMNLIYQLSEFKSKLLRGQGPSGPAWHSWRNPGSGRSNFGSGHSAAVRSIPSQDNPAAASQDRSMNPFQASQESPPVRANSWTMANTSAPFDASFAGNVTSGPSSAPPDVQSHPCIAGGSPANQSSHHIPIEQSEIDPPPKEMDLDADTDISPTTHVDPSPGPDNNSSCNPLPTMKPLAPPAGFNSLSSRRQGQPKLSLRPDIFAFTGRPPPPPSPPLGFDHPMVDRVPASLAIMSPRAAEFTASPFHRTAAGDLAGSSVFEQGLMSPKSRSEDPRSPAATQRGNASLMRNIFDVL